MNLTKEQFKAKAKKIIDNKMFCCDEAIKRT